MQIVTCVSTTLIVSPFSLFLCLVILSIFLVLNVICMGISFGN